MAAATSATIAPVGAPSSRQRWLAWTSVILYAALASASLAIELRFVGRMTALDIWVVLAVLGCAVIGALIVSTHHAHPIGWMFCGAAVSFGFAFFAREYAVLALVVAPGTLPFGEAMAWFGFWADMPGIAVIALFLPLLFPDGRLPSPRWRPAAYFAAANVILAVAITMVAPDTYAEGGYPSIRNPIGLDQYAGLFDTVFATLQPLLLVLVAVSAAALFARLRRAGDEERQQLKWFGYAGALVLGSFFIEAIARFVPRLPAPAIWSPHSR